MSSENLSFVEQLVETTRINRVRVKEETTRDIWDMFQELATKAAKEGKSKCKLHFYTDYPELVIEMFQDAHCTVTCANGLIYDMDNSGRIIFTISWSVGSK